MTGSGDLRRRVLFEKRYPVADEGGGTKSRWFPQFARWAKVQPLRGGEGVQEQRLQGTQPSIIIVRSDSETRQITPEWRAVETLFGGGKRYYGLKTAEDMERESEFITLLGVAGDPDGR